jgi:uncharacterized tellurite resistance protein B-like protein
MEFSLAEKLALIRAIEDVIEADGQVNLKEVEIMKQLSYFLNFDMSIVEEARKLSRAESLLLLRGMARNKKKSLGLILKEVANSDGKINQEELLTLYGIFKEAGIND